MNKVDLIHDLWYYQFKSNKELNIILLTLNVFGKERFKFNIKQLDYGYIYNGYIHYAAIQTMTKERFSSSFSEVTLDYILNYVP